jgi:hypothetical protein
MLWDRYVLPEAERPTRSPKAPKLQPIPPFDRLMRNGPRLNDLRHCQLIEAASLGRRLCVGVGLRKLREGRLDLRC